MIHKMQNKALYGVSAALLGVALAGCGGNDASTDNASTEGATTSTSTTTTSASTPDSAVSNPALSNSTAGTSSTGSSGATSSAASFKSASATWGKVMTANAALDKVIKSKDLKTVHEAAFKVRDIVKTLPAQSQAMSADKQKTLASQVKNVEQLASKLDEAGDSNNMAATKDNQAGLNDALDIIKGLYPAGTLK